MADFHAHTTRLKYTAHHSGLIGTFVKTTSLTYLLKSVNAIGRQFEQLQYLIDIERNSDRSDQATYVRVQLSREATYVLVHARLATANMTDF